MTQSVIHSLRHGFWPYANIDLAAPDTFNFSHQDLHGSDKELVLSLCEDKVKSQCFLAPFGPNLYAGVYSQLVGIVPKPHTKERQIVVDQSAGLHSLNLWMHKSDASVRLDSLQDFGAILHLCCRHAALLVVYLFKDDVSKAYQCMPTHPLWQIKQVVTIGGQHYVD